LVGLGPPRHLAQAPTTLAVPFDHSFPKLHRPDLPARAFVVPGPIGRTLLADRSSFDRYVTFDPQRASSQVTSARPPTLRIDPAAYEDGQSILLGLDEIQGYSPVQLDRYWRLVRRVDRVPLFYSAATFQSLPPQILKLFGVRWVIASGSPPQGMSEVGREGSNVLYRVDQAVGRTSVVFSWRRLASGQALDAVLAPGFDAGQTAILEEDPKLGATVLTQPGKGATGEATYDETDPEHVVVRTTTSAPGLLVIRNAFDEGWHAKVDGEDAPLLRADYLMQAVAVPAGQHTVELEYRDPWIVGGLLVSGAAWVILLFVLVAAAMWRRPGIRAAAPMLSDHP
jgi:hypothetical protein